MPTSRRTPRTRLVAALVISVINWIFGIILRPRSKE